jgi:hypothetical protein
VESPRLYSLLCLEVCSLELARVLTDARCSFFDTEGRFTLARPELLSGRSTEVGRFAAAVLQRPREAGSSSTIDLTAGRVRGSAAALTNPIALLHWLMAQSSAVDFHPSIRAYISSSDPDDILPFVPFHPAFGAGAEGDSALVVVRVPGYRDAAPRAGASSLRLGSTDFLLPS